jgi:CheY-like chemotaxis protein
MRNRIQVLVVDDSPVDQALLIAALEGDFDRSGRTK